MRVLVFAPHNDDEILGVGGTMAKLSRQGHAVYVCEVTSGSDPERTKRIRTEALKAHRIIGVADTIFLDLPVVGLKHISTKILNAKILDVVQSIRPNLAFIPHIGDMHIDHVEVAQSAMVALRPPNNPELKAIYAYETLSETGWSGPMIDQAFIPNVWSDISETIEVKLEAMACFNSQLLEYPHPRSLKAIRSLSEYRGATVCVDNAESFVLIREVIR